MKSFYITLLTFAVLLYLCASEADSDLQSILTQYSEATIPEDGKLNFTGLAKKYGHDPEQFDVVTEDGYILTVFRLPGEKPPVLLFHGLGDTADAFLLRGYNSLSIALADAGYDVWVGNNRGNKYARRHVQFNPDTDPKYWDFSFHEVGYYDLATTIDIVCEKTDQDSISTISHSQGGTAFFVLGSLRPEYNNRVNVMIALAPAVFFNHIKPPLTILTAAGPEINALIPPGIRNFPKNGGVLSNLIKFVCSKGLASYALCGLGVLFPFIGFNPASFDPEYLNILLGHYPETFSRKTLLHYDQLCLEGRFCKYDYGKDINLGNYGSTSPPDYDLSAVCMKVALFVGENDKIATVQDVEHLSDSLPNVVHFEIVKPKLWNHLDFLYNIDMPKYLFPSIFNLLKKYN